MSQLLDQCMAKATIAEGDQMKHGPNWIMARRARLKIFDDYLECGDWVVPYDSIQEAILYSVRMNFAIPGYVLKVVTDDKTYHFGLNFGSFWKNELPFPVIRKKGRLGYSPFSLAIRILLLVALIYWIWQRFFISS